MSNVPRQPPVEDPLIARGQDVAFGPLVHELLRRGWELGARGNLFFVCLPALTHPRSDVEWIRAGRAAPPHGGTGLYVGTRLFGLLGTVSPLPEYLRHYARTGQRPGAERPKNAEARPYAARLTILLQAISHRLLHLQYEIWRIASPPFLDRDGVDRQFHRPARSLSGLADDGVELEDLPFVNAWVALLGIRPRNAWALGELLRRSLEVQVQVEEWSLRPIRLTDDGANRIGSRNARLGRTFRLGTIALDRSLGVTLKIGPLSFGEYLSFVPGGGNHERLVMIARRFVPPEVVLWVQTLLAPEESAKCEFRLGNPATRLGYTSRLPGEHFGARVCVDKPLFDAPAGAAA